MEVDNSDWKVISKAIDDWVSEGKLTTDQADDLRQSLKLKETGQQVAKYFFLIALSCTMMAFGAIFIDEKLLERLKIYFELSNWIIAIVMAVLAVSWFWYVKKKQSQTKNIAYEVFAVLGGLASMTSLVYVCKDIGFGASYTGFLFVAMAMLICLSLFLKSRSLWIAGLVAVAAWYGGITFELGQAHSFLGMNYPARYTLLGMLLLGFWILQRRIPRLQYSVQLTYLAGLIVFFLGLWGVSIFGNYSDFEAWLQVRQTQVIAYSLVFGAAAFVSFYLGVKYRDDLARDLGILFLLVNFYSRYFEFFWDSMHKGVFFLVLAVSFWFLGRWIEKRRKGKTS